VRSHAEPPTLRGHAEREPCGATRSHAGSHAEPPTLRSHAERAMRKPPTFRSHAEVSIAALKGAIFAGQREPASRCPDGRKYPCLFSVAPTKSIVVRGPVRAQKWLLSKPRSTRIRSRDRSVEALAHTGGLITRSFPTELGGAPLTPLAARFSSLRPGDPFAVPAGRWLLSRRRTWSRSGLRCGHAPSHRDGRLTEIRVATDRNRSQGPAAPGASTGGLDVGGNDAHIDTVYSWVTRARRPLGRPDQDLYLKQVGIPN
jgi:hypothetical protein